MAGVALVNLALGARSSLVRAVGDSGPPPSLDVNVAGAGGDTINLDGGRNTINVRNGAPDTVTCRNGGPNVTAFDPGLDTVTPDCNSPTLAPPTPTPTPTPTVGMVKLARTPRLSGRRLAIRLPSANTCVDTLRVYVARRRVMARAVPMGSFAARTVSVTLGRRDRARLLRGSTLTLTYAGLRVFSGHPRTR
jgi:hypothetical protein